MVTFCPLLPFFVVIRTTPKAARAPYTAADEASFNTETLSISCGFNKEMSLVSTPSTRINAEPPFKEVIPRTLKVAVAFGLPLGMVMFKLGIAP